MVPVLGFNSAKYDLNLLRQQLITTYLREYGGEIKVIKQQSAYSKIDLGGCLRFLNVYKYCSPNTNLDSFMKAEGVVGGKFFFPYEWFDSYEKLDHPELPPAECFYSSLTLHEKLTLSTFKFSLKTFFKHLYTPLRLPLSIS